MSLDPHGQLHAGAIGLYDDPEELASTDARREYQRKKKERKDEDKLRKWDGDDERAAVKAKQKRLEKEQDISWWSRLFRSDTNRLEVDSASALWEPLIPPTVPAWVVNARLREQRRENEEANAGKAGKQEAEMFDAVNVDHELDSPFYDELDLVLVRGSPVQHDRVIGKSQVRAPQDGSNGPEKVGSKRRTRYMCSEDV